MSKKSEKILSPIDLPTRQQQVLRLLADGETTIGIGLKLRISPKTVEWHRVELMKRTGLFCVADLTKLAIRLGLTKIDV